MPRTLKSVFLFFKQVAHEIPAPDCEAFIELGSKTICDVTEAVSLIKQAQNMYVCLTALQAKHNHFTLYPACRCLGSKPARTEGKRNPSLCRGNYYPYGSWNHCV